MIVGSYRTGIVTQVAYAEIISQRIGGALSENRFLLAMWTCANCAVILMAPSNRIR